MAGLLFGTGGTPLSAKNRSTVAGIERIAELGLGCMEVEFVQGVHMGKETALQVAAISTRLKIKLTAHAPYFVNFNSSETEKIEASRYRIIQTARVGKLCGVESVVFHAAFNGGDAPERVYQSVKQNLAEVITQLAGEGNRIWLRPEVMGRGTQFGTVEEVAKLSHELKGVLPAIDFAHWHARTGENNTYNEFAAVLEYIISYLGQNAISVMHLHISGIKYSARGEVKHVNLNDSDFNYPDLLRALKDYEVGGFAICESPNLENDALLMQKIYRELT